MAKIFHKPYNVNLPKSKRSEQEFAAHKGIVLCSDCGAAYFKKRWVHGLEKINTAGKTDLPVSNGICPACQMIKNQQYEGRIMIKNFPDGQAQELEGLVRGFGERAFDRDPMDRIIEIDKSGSTWRITTTENELANKLAHKIKNQFKNAKSRTHFAPEPSDVAEITIEFS